MICQPRAPAALLLANKLSSPVPWVGCSGLDVLQKRKIFCLCWDSSVSSFSMWPGDCTDYVMPADVDNILTEQTDRQITTGDIVYHVQIMMTCKMLQRFNIPIILRASDTSNKETFLVMIIVVPKHICGFEKQVLLNSMKKEMRYRRRKFQVICST